MSQMIFSVSKMTIEKPKIKTRTEKTSPSMLPRSKKDNPKSTVIFSTNHLKPNCKLLLIF